MGILANFIGGVGKGAADIADGHILAEQRQKEAKYADDLARAREQTTMELRKQYEQERDQYLASPEYLEMQAKAEAAKATAKLDTEAALIPKKAANVAAEFDAGASTREKANKERLTFTLDEYRQKTAAELEAEIKKLNDPKYLQGKAKEAAAGRDPNSAALHRVQLETAQMALMEKKAEAKIPPAVKGSIASIQKQADAISAAITKAELDGSASPEAVQKYQTRLSELNGQITKLYEPYLSERDRASLAPKAAAGGMQDVRVGGKVIGKASTPEEAAAMVTEYRKGGKATPAAGTKEAPAPAGPPVDRLRDQPIGILTPLATIQEAAAAGNKQAIAYLDRRSRGQSDTAAAPRTAADMLNQ